MLALHSESSWYLVIQFSDVANSSAVSCSIPQANVHSLDVNPMGYKAQSMYKNGGRIQVGEYVSVNDPWDRTTSSQYCEVVSFIMAKVRRAGVMAFEHPQGQLVHFTLGARNVEELYDWSLWDMHRTQGFLEQFSYHCVCNLQIRCLHRETEVCRHCHQEGHHVPGNCWECKHSSRTLLVYSHR